MSVKLGKLWKPVVKGGHFPGGYFRATGVARSSKKVKQINNKFREAARSCKGKKTSDGSFQACVGDKMRGGKI
jgi:hypothetical protein